MLKVTFTIHLCNGMTTHFTPTHMVLYNIYIKSELYLCKIFRSRRLYISCLIPRRFCTPRFSLWVFSWICSTSVSFLILLTTTFSVFSILLVCF